MFLPAGKPRGSPVAVKVLRPRSSGPHNFHGDRRRGRNPPVRPVLRRSARPQRGARGGQRRSGAGEGAAGHSTRDAVSESLPNIRVAYDCSGRFRLSESLMTVRVASEYPSRL